MALFTVHTWSLINMERNRLFKHESLFSDCSKHEKAKCHFEAFNMWKTFNVSKGLIFCFQRLINPAIL